MITQSTPPRPTTTNPINKLRMHIEGGIRMNTLHNGKKVEIYWNKLPEGKQRTVRYSQYDC